MQGFQTIEVNGNVLFEKAAMTGQSSHVGELEDRACFLFMLKGNNVAVEQMGMTEVRATDGIMKRCSQYVSHFVADESDDYCEAVAIYFYPDFIKKIFKNEIVQFASVPSTDFNTRKVVSNTLIHQYIKGLNPYFEVPELMDVEMASIKIKELVQLLLKSENRNSVLEFFSEIFASPTEVTFGDIIENNLYSDITMDHSLTSAT
ncbi:MAG: hypothetical protein ACI9UJ_002559 [bacterium]|jgi:hypothetical protein